MFDKGEDYYKSNEFIDKLNSKNSLNLNFAWDQISLGYFFGKHFFSFSTGTRIEMGATMPKGLFTFMRDFNGVEDLDWTNGGKGLNWDLSGEKLNMMVYQEVAFGYARRITDKLTVGGRAKLLLGAANLDFKITDMSIKTPAGINIDEIKKIQDGQNLDWSKFTSEDYKNYAELVKVRNQISGESHIGVEGSMKASMGGLEWKHDGDSKIINGIEMNGFKISGYGFGIDLGATYQVMDNLKVTAAVTDLGFISWGKSNSKKVDIGVDDSFNLNVGNDDDLFKFAQKVSNNEVINFDMLKMEETDGDSYTTSLYTTLALGGQYTLLDDKLVLGALYTGRFAQPKMLNELTLSGAYNLSPWLNVALSYSMIQSAGKSFGIGLKAGPIYLGTDYMFFGNSSQCVNFMAGLSIPLSKAKNF